MSSIPQNHFDENDLIDCVQRFFSKHHVGKLLAKCNGMKEKGVSPVALLRYKPQLSSSNGFSCFQ